MARKLFILLVTLALCSIAPAWANVITGGSLSASCTDYTVTFTGADFVTGETVNITWQVAVRYNGGPVVYETGSTSLNSGDGGSVTNPSKSITVPWSQSTCGDVQILTPGQDGGQGSRFSWQSVNNPQASGAGPLLITSPAADVNGNYFFHCDCPPPPPSTTAICRTPGFWGTHAGTEKKNSQNIVQAILDATGGFTICGNKLINNTNLLSTMSAEEGICVSPQGDQKLQLGRQLASAMLNCIMSTPSGTSCDGTSIEVLFGQCDALCASGGSAQAIGSCITQLDCFNNGGVWNGSMCVIGTCGGDGVTPCSKSADCGLDPSGAPIACVPNTGDCHDQPLVNTDRGFNFEPPGPAGSSNKCNAATTNTCTLWGGC